MSNIIQNLEDITDSKELIEAKNIKDKSARKVHVKNIIGCSNYPKCRFTYNN